MRCSVDAAEVRPFWKRFWAIFGTGAFVLYFVATLGVFIAFRIIGYGVSYRHVVWPLAWRHFDEVRSVYFFEKGRAALTTNNINEAMLSLDLAYNLDPRNYSAGFALAQLWQGGQPTLSDRLYARLMVSHPDERSKTAEAWYHALLLRGDYLKICGLAAERLRLSNTVPGAWLHALIFASRMQGDIAPLRDLLAAEPAPAPDIRAVVELEILARSGKKDEVRKLLDRPLPANAAPYTRYYQVTQLIALADASRALALLDQYGSRFKDDERVALRLNAFGRMGWSTARRGEAEALLIAAPGASSYELLAAHLVRYPEPEILSRIFERLAKSPLPANASSFPAYAALFCAAGVAGDAAKLRATRLALMESAGANFNALAPIEAFFLGKTAERRIDSFLPALRELPLGVTYELLERYKPATLRIRRE